MLKKYFAEFLGTAILVTFGCGAAATGVIASSELSLPSYVGIALTFGLVIVALAYSIGRISGCHVNPAVSTAMLILGKMTPAEFCGYVISQCLGAVVGSLIMCSMFLGPQGIPGFGTNGYGEASAINISAAGAFITEIVLTFVFVFAICGVTSTEKFSRISGVVIGFSLTLVHLVGLPITGTSVNPARSLGAAVGAAMFGETTAIAQVWVFLLAPLVGGALAALCWKLLAGDLRDEPEEAPAPAPSAKDPAKAPAKGKSSGRKRK